MQEKEQTLRKQRFFFFFPVRELATLFSNVKAVILATVSY